MRTHDRTEELDAALRDFRRTLAATPPGRAVYALLQWGDAQPIVQRHPHLLGIAIGTPIAALLIVLIELSR